MIGWVFETQTNKQTYCAPLVCISAVIGLLAVWRCNKPKTKKKTKKKVGSSKRVLVMNKIESGNAACKFVIQLFESYILIHSFKRPYGQKLDLSGVCFEWYISARSVRKCIFLKIRKAEQKHCVNWWPESSSEFHKAYPMCERGEWRKQLQDFITQSLKQSPLGSGTISSFFWPNGNAAAYNVCDLEMLVCREQKNYS